MLKRQNLATRSQSRGPWTWSGIVIACVSQRANRHYTRREKSRPGSLGPAEVPVALVTLSRGNGPWGNADVRSFMCDLEAGASDPNGALEAQLQWALRRPQAH